MNSSLTSRHRKWTFHRCRRDVALFWSRVRRFSCCWGEERSTPAAAHFHLPTVRRHSSSMPFYPEFEKAIRRKTGRENSRQVIIRSRITRDQLVLAYVRALYTIVTDTMYCMSLSSTHQYNPSQGECGSLRGAGHWQRVSLRPPTTTGLCYSRICNMAVLVDTVLGGLAWGLDFNSQYPSHNHGKTAVGILTESPYGNSRGNSHTHDNHSLRVLTDMNESSFVSSIWIIRLRCLCFYVDGAKFLPSHHAARTATNPLHN